MGPWELSAAMSPDSWDALQTYSTARWTLSPYFPRPGRLPPDMRARPARPVMPAPLEPSDQEPFLAWRDARKARPFSMAAWAPGVISSPRTWLGWAAMPIFLAAAGVRGLSWARAGRDGSVVVARAARVVRRSFLRVMGASSFQMSKGKVED